MFNADKNLMEKWAPVLGHADVPSIQDSHKAAVTARLLENQEIAAREEAQAVQGNFIGEAAGNVVGAGMGATAGAIKGFDPVLISLVRRAMPNLIAYDIAGVQPMSGPTGLIFAMKSRYTNQSGAEALHDEANTAFSGGGTQEAGPSGLEAAADDGDGSLATGETAGEIFSTVGAGLTTAQAEALGDGGGTTFGEMAFSIDKATVTAKSRALKAEYTMELAQDLKAVHGLDAEGELANILSSEILAEINREVIRTIYKTAEQGAAQNTATAGIFDLDIDSNGRWSVEKFKGLLFQIERDANAIAQRTRRGKGNMVLCSADVASALTMAGILDYTPALNANLNVDDTGNTFAGTINGKFRVYIDPYSANLTSGNGANGNQYYVVGYKGSSPYDAGLFYCPYVPLQMVRAVGENSFQPKIGFKTRYGLVANPFAEGDATRQGLGRLRINSNRYYRRVAVKNLM